MGNKIITEKDFWQCSGGLMPTQFQSGQSKAKKKSGEKYITKMDTATVSFADFSCKKLMLIMAILAALIAVATVATGGAALIAIGAIAGAAGAAYGAVLGSLLCGQMVAKVRKWTMGKENFQIMGIPTITGDHVMLCPLFNETITFNPDIKTWGQALLMGGASFTANVIKGALSGMMVGAATIALPALAQGGTVAFAQGGLLNLSRFLGNNLVRNYIASWVTTEGLAIRGAMALESTLAGYGNKGYVSKEDVENGIFGLEKGTAQSAVNIFTGKGTILDIVGLALWFAPTANVIRGNNTRSKAKTENSKGKDNTVIENKATEVTKENKTNKDGEAFEVGSVKNRVKAMEEVMTDGEKGRTTYSVARVKLTNGATEFWVSGAGKKGYVPPRIRKAAGTEKVITNKVNEGNAENRLNDAEQTILREAKEQGANIEDIGATRDMCHKCQEVFIEEGVIDKVSTPLKK